MRLAGCYFKLETPLNDIIDELDAIYNVHGNTNAGNTAKHYLAGLYATQGDHSQALQCNDEMINVFVENNDSEMAANALMDGIIFCETIPEENFRLDKSNVLNKKESYYRKLMEDYPNSEAAKTVSEMFELTMPSTDIPNEYKLFKCFPNPYNPVTKITFDLPKYENARLEVFNVRGQLVNTLLDDDLNAGHYEVIFDATGLSSGIYLYKFTAGDYVAVNRMTILK